MIIVWAFDDDDDDDVEMRKDIDTQCFTNVLKCAKIIHLNYYKLQRW